MQRKIAVAGGTGRIGSHIVELLRERGYEAVPMSRSTGVDVITGDGLDAALDGVGTIIDAATGPSPDEAEATAFFTAAARNLQAAGERAGVERMVVVSIIGIDRFSGGYNAAKVAQERHRARRAGPGPHRPRRAVPRVRLAARRLGPAGRRQPRLEDADAAGGRPRRRRGGRRTPRSPRTSRPARSPRSQGRARSRWRRRHGCSSPSAARRCGSRPGWTRRSRTPSCTRAAGRSPARARSSRGRRSPTGSAS